MIEVTLEEVDVAIEDLAHTGSMHKDLFGHKAFRVLLKIKKQLLENEE